MKREEIGVLFGVEKQVEVGASSSAGQTTGESICDFSEVVGAHVFIGGFVVIDAGNAFFEPVGIILFGIMP